MLAEGSTAPDFETWIMVANPGARDANIRLTFMATDGVFEGPSVTIEAGSRTTFDVANTVGSVFEVSARVTSDEPVVVERSVYGNDI